MKNYFAMAGIFAALCFTTFSGNAQCCNEGCSSVKDYYLKDKSNSPYMADVRIDTFKITKDADQLILHIRVRNTGNADAFETRLIVLLPQNVHIEEVIDKHYKIGSVIRCGGRIEFCIGQLGTCQIASDTAKTRYVTIRTSTAKMSAYAGKETFAAFLSSSRPDKCPLDNYRAWVNDGVLCRDINPATLVQKGSND